MSQNRRGPTGSHIPGWCYKTLGKRSPPVRKITIMFVKVDVFYQFKSVIIVEDLQCPRDVRCRSEKI